MIIEGVIVFACVCFAAWYLKRELTFIRSMRARLDDLLSEEDRDA